jgi:hypothetical protein
LVSAPQSKNLDVDDVAHHLALLPVAHRVQPADAVVIERLPTLPGRFEVHEDLPVPGHRLVHAPVHDQIEGPALLRLTLDVVAQERDLVLEVHLHLVLHRGRRRGEHVLGDLLLLVLGQHDRLTGGALATRGNGGERGSGQQGLPGATTNEVAHVGGISMIRRANGGYERPPGPALDPEVAAG